VGSMASAVLLSQPLLALSRHVVRAQGAFSTHNDVAAMRWIRANTAPQARILNYPGDRDKGFDWEAHWAPVITERDCVYFRMQLFFVPGSIDTTADAVAAASAEQQELVSFWRDPADPANGERLRRAHVSYVLVPESVGDPSAASASWRWQPPALLPHTVSSPADAPYLRLVHASGGAQVYAVIADRS
jgi:hypothetical protein